MAGGAWAPAAASEMRSRLVKIHALADIGRAAAVCLTVRAALCAEERQCMSEEEHTIPHLICAVAQLKGMQPLQRVPAATTWSVGLL